MFSGLASIPDVARHRCNGSEQRPRNGQPQRLRGLEVDHELELGWPLNREIGRRHTSENTSNVDRDPTMCIRQSAQATHVPVEEPSTASEVVIAVRQSVSPVIHQNPQTVLTLSVKASISTHFGATGRMDLFNLLAAARTYPQSGMPCLTETKQANRFLIPQTYVGQRTGANAMQRRSLRRPYRRRRRFYSTL